MQKQWRRGKKEEENEEEREGNACMARQGKRERDGEISGEKSRSHLVYTICANDVQLGGRGRASATTTVVASAAAFARRSTCVFKGTRAAKGAAEKRRRETHAYLLLWTSERVSQRRQERERKRFSRPQTSAFTGKGNTRGKRKEREK